MTNAQIDFMKLMQDFVAVGALGGNALRNQEPGVVTTIQAHLATLPLRDVPSTSAESYELWLDSRTEEILSGLRVEVRPWGTVRKALNLFMRACICDFYLRGQYALERVEPLAEMPLDGVVAIALKREAGRGRLPVWPGLKRLTSDAHRRFQAFATGYAQRLGLPARVYLDNYLWLKNR